MTHAVAVINRVEGLKADAQALNRSVFQKRVGFFGLLHRERQFSFGFESVGAVGERNNANRVAVLPQKRSLFGRRERFGEGTLVYDVINGIGLAAICGRVSFKLAVVG